MTTTIKKYSHDPAADAIYITLSDSKAVRTKSLDDTRLIDYGADGNPVGIEYI